MTDKTINAGVNQEVKNLKDNLIIDIKRAEQIPPGKKRKRYLKKIFISFLKGVGFAAGILGTAAVIYKVSEKGIQKKIDNHVNKSLDNTFTTLERKIPGVSLQVQNELKGVVKSLEPVQDEVIRNAVKTGMSEGMHQLERSKPQLNATVSDLGNTALETLKESLKGSPAGYMVGAPKSKTTVPAATASAASVFKRRSNPANKHQRVRLQVDESKIMQGRTRAERAKLLANEEKLVRDNAAKVVQRVYRKKYRPTIGIFGREYTTSPGYTKPGIQEVEFGKKIKLKKLKKKN
jgi:hypothetical protein